MNEIKLDCKLEKESITLSNNETLLYLLVNISANEKLSISKNKFINTCMVIDKSGSMYDDGKLDNVIASLKHLCQKASGNDKFSIVAFADKGELVFSNDKQSNIKEYDHIINSLDDLDLGYKTDLYKGLEVAVKEVKRNFIKDGINKIIILTDGEVDTPNECLNLVEKEKCNGISFTTIGLGEEFNEEFLIKLAEQSGANSHYIEKGEDIPSIFEKEFEGLKNSVMSNCEIKVLCEKGVSLKRLSKAYPSVATFSENTIKIDKINLNETQSVLIELSVIPGKTGKNPLCSILFFENGKEITREKVFYSVVKESLVTQKINNIVTKAITRVRTQNLQTKALQQLKKGDTAGAKDLLTRVISVKDKNKTDKYDELVTRAIKQISVTKRLDPVTTKRLTYSLK